MELGYDRVLTTGGDPAVAQPGALARLVERGGADIVILASGGLRAHNVAEVVAACGAREVHMRAPGTSGTDRSEVERIVAALRGSRISSVLTNTADSSDKSASRV